MFCDVTGFGPVRRHPGRSDPGVKSLSIGRDKISLYYYRCVLVCTSRTCSVKRRGVFSWPQAGVALLAEGKGANRGKGQKGVV